MRFEGKEGENWGEPIPILSSSFEGSKKRCWLRLCERSNHSFEQRSERTKKGEEEEEASAGPLAIENGKEEEEEEEGEGEESREERERGWEGKNEKVTDAMRAT